MSEYRPMPLQFTRLSPEEQIDRSRSFLHTMRGRRSVRFFSSEPYPLELIENAVATAGTAPSGANQQPWTFVAVTDPALKARIRAAAEEEERISYGGRMSPEWIAALAHLGTDWHKEHLTIAPTVIVVFAQAYGLAVDPATGEERQIKHYYVQESVGIAVGLLLASLRQAGLATLTHTPSPMGFLAELLERPRNERAFLVIPVGYPAEGCVVPTITKKPLNDILIRK